MARQSSVPNSCRNIGINVRGSIVDLSSLAVWCICKGVLHTLPNICRPHLQMIISGNQGVKFAPLIIFLEINCLLTTRYFHPSLPTSTDKQFLLLDSAYWELRWYEQASALFRMLKFPCLLFLPEKAKMLYALDFVMKGHGWFRIHVTRKTLQLQWTKRALKSWIIPVATELSFSLHICGVEGLVLPWSLRTRTCYATQRSVFPRLASGWWQENAWWTNDFVYHSNWLFLV